VERLGLILAVAAVTYATRIAGFSLDRRVIPQRVDRALTYVPIAAFSALIVPGLSDDGGNFALPRIAAVVIAAVTVLLTRQLWAGLLMGMVAFWLL
jgi:branched chain amino acid efflux pump